MLVLLLCCMSAVVANLLTGNIKITPDSAICETTSMVDEICISSNDTAVVTGYLDVESHGLLFTCDYTCTDENFEFVIILNDFTYYLPRMNLGNNVINVTITNSVYGYAMFLVNIIGMNNGSDTPGDLKLANMNLIYVDVPPMSTESIAIIGGLSALVLIITVFVSCAIRRPCKKKKYETFNDVDTFM